MTRRDLLMLLAGGSCALLAACQAPRPSSTPKVTAGAAAGQPWDQLVEAARQEGELNLYGAISAGSRDALVAPFQKAFPGIVVNGAFAPASDLIARILAEREAKKFISDVIVGPKTQAVSTLKPIGGVAPLMPALMLPEVLDLSAWLEQRLWWVDASEPYTTLAFQGYVDTTLSYNNKLVDGRQFQSFWDLVKPEWKGKMVANDPRRPGQGNSQVRFIYQNKDVGPAMLDRLFGDMGLTLSTDHRQMVDWLGQGRYQLGLWVSTTEIKSAQSQGLPVAEVSGDQFKEGAAIVSGGGTINLAGSAPHPNAAKVFVNWLLSRDGQIAWQDHVKQPSLRQDVPKEKLDPGNLPKPGVSYVDSGTEEFQKTSEKEVNELITGALARGKP